MDRRTITGRPRRKRTTHSSVVWMDRIARSIIAIGGIGTIVAVGLVFVFLIWVVAPLFLPAKISASVEPPPTQSAAAKKTGGEKIEPGLIGRFRSPAGDSEVLIWKSGLVEQHVVSSGTSKGHNDSIALTEKHVGSSEITAAVALPGGLTWFVGDSAGTATALFRAQKQLGKEHFIGLIVGHRFERAGHAVTALAASTRGRIVAIGYEDGLVRLVHVTAERQLVETNVGSRVDALSLTPKNDGLYVTIKDKQAYFKLSMPHPDVSVASLSLPVWYEGYSKPEMVWQSSGGDTTEAKLGLASLIFGTIKATFYSMLFGAPLAFLAAIYTSQFVGSQARSVFKPTIEFMASLPSVVLGIFAALLVAPWVEDRLIIVLCSLYSMPVTLLVAAHVWQLLPDRIALRSPKLRLIAIAASLPIGLLLAIWIGPAIESTLFDADIKRWLDARPDHVSLLNSTFVWAGWLFPMLPISAAFVAWVVSRSINPWLHRRHAESSRQRVAFAHLVKFVLGVVATLYVAFAGAWLLGNMFDARGVFVDTFDQRNALVVGFVMGFAVIPIIYTVADDALSAVPDSLKSASLGAGATQWQTTVRIVVPAAISGLFSAFMIGLGRAVGETMIVLMAAGNTPIMQWNVFNGFRTLSATIAVEIPEAVKDSTHYRTLFLAALVLFAMTFVLNTVAEFVRRRFQRRSMQ